MVTAHRVYLSPSNQMHNRCQYGDLEGQHCPQLAAMIGERLTALGIEWKIRTPANSLTANMKEAKAFGAELYIPLHTNAGGAAVRGTRFGYNSSRTDSKQACTVFLNRWRAFYPLPEKAKLAVYDHFGEAKSPHCPSVYTELIFHSNIDDATFLHEHMGECADTLVQCIVDYFAMKEGGTLPVTYATVKLGSKGDSVTKLQELLIANGKQLTVDGSFGPDTETKLKEYQTSKGLEADGVCGPVTWAALTASEPATPTLESRVSALEAACKAAGIIT